MSIRLSELHDNRTRQICPVSTLNLASTGDSVMRRYLVVVVILVVQLVLRSAITDLNLFSMSVAHAATPTATLTPTPTLVIAGTRQVPWGANPDPTKQSRWVKLGSPYHRGQAEFARDFNWGNTDDDLGFDITAAETGVVIRASCTDRLSQSGYGCYVELRHGSGTWNSYHSFYAHMQGPSRVQNNVTACVGEQIGEIGRTGLTGNYPHLHFHMTRSINNVEVAYKWTNMGAKHLLQFTNVFGGCSTYSTSQFTNGSHWKTCGWCGCQ